MQRIVSILPSWDKTKSGSKKGFDKAWGWADKLGAPLNRQTNRIGSEAFWPTTLDKESDKAARILRSFCKDGFYTEAERTTAISGPQQKQKVLMKIPQKVIENAVGLAIFTTLRAGLWMSGAGGSGVLIARMEDGSWSPPSGILLHTAGLGFLLGIDIYDCVLVINNRKALESFTKLRATVGGEVSAVAGPVGIGGILENDGKWKQANRPVFTYLKSRGFYAGVQVDGTIMIERSDENERFYGERLSASDILAGKARHPPPEIKMLLETVKAAEGRKDVDENMMEELEDQPAPGDVGLDAPRKLVTGPVFGIPELDDPDPFGVLALEREGLEIREAGTRSRPPSSQFEYRPSPTSPIYQHFQRRSMDTLSINRRESILSTKRNSIDRSTQTPDLNTPRELDTPATPTTIASPTILVEHKIPEEDEPVGESAGIDYTKVIEEPFDTINDNNSHEFNGSGTTAIEHEEDAEPKSPQLAHLDPESIDDGRSSVYDSDVDDVHSVHSIASDLVGESDEEEEAVIFEAATAQSTRGAPTPQVNILPGRGSIVTIAKRLPPALPPRSPMRRAASSSMDSALSPKPAGVSPLPSPLRDGFDATSVRGSGDEVRKSIDTMASESLRKESLPHKVEQAVAHKEPQHLTDDRMEKGTTILEKPEILAENPVTHRVKLNENEPDHEDTFHSMPTTPLETAVR